MLFFKPFNILKNYLFLVCLSLVFRSESGCKDKEFYLILPNFFASFFSRNFSRTCFQNPRTNLKPFVLKADAKVMLLFLTSKLFAKFFLKFFFRSLSPYTILKNYCYQKLSVNQFFNPSYLLYCFRCHFLIAGAKIHPFITYFQIF